MISAAQNRNCTLGMCGRTATTALALAIMLVLAVFATGSAQAQAFTTLADFQGSANGAEPLYGNLIQGTDGNNYGTTYGGGFYDQGTVFKVTPDGTVTTLYTFCSQINCTDGAEPVLGLVQAGGNFYGTTEGGGANGVGTVFQVTPGGQLTTLYSFCSQPGCTDGAFPFAGLVQAGGNFYGTTYEGGANDSGTVFKITPAGQLTTLYSFCSQPGCTDGAFPFAGLVQAGGNFYGTTEQGGANGGLGTVFEITPAGQLTTLHSFGFNDGAFPEAGLVQAGGNFYGTTSDGGANGNAFGTVFEITPAGQLTTLYGFCQTDCSDGEIPYAGLIQASDGNLYGTTEDGGADGYGTVFGITPAGQLSTLHSFALTDGAYPDGGLLEANGNLYGTTYFGGSRLDGTVFSLPVGLVPKAKTQSSFGKAGANIMILRPDLTGATGLRLGAKAEENLFIHRHDLAGRTGERLSRDEAVFPGLRRTKLRTRELAEAAVGPMKVTAPTGKAKSVAQTLTTLLNFDGANGAFPYRTFLIQGADGNLYGTDAGGGAYDQGTVFKVTAGGTLTTLYTFCSQINCTDGAEPEAGLVQATNGNFYGTTLYGGANDRGTVYEVTPVGQLTTLYSFCSQAGCTDGAYPIAGLVQATDGNLYGTTNSGGAIGDGTVFKITPAGQVATLYSFCSQGNCADGALPRGKLIQASDGNLYGTTFFGGANFRGTVFQLTLAGHLSTLYNFCPQPNCSDGRNPDAGLVQASDGNLYGTTQSGGANSRGTVFKVTLAGQLSTPYSFCSQPKCSDGANPQAGLIQATDGNLYGTTSNGGANFDGTVFEITPAGQLTTLYAFGLTDGAFPAGGLLQSGGNLYGTTEVGGNRFDGTIFSLPVAQQGLTLSCPAFTAQVGVAYNSALTATGGVAPYTFSIASGSLPPGLTLNTSTGAITGTPTTGGTYNFTPQVVDSQSNTVTTNCGIVVSPIPLTLSCPTPTGQVGVAYSSALKAIGGVAPYTFSIISGSLPPGLTLNTSTGAITGTPATAGTYNFTSQVVDSQNNKATAGCSITVNAANSCTNNGNLNGNYAFLFQGLSNINGNGYVLADFAGSFVFDGNGNLTSGQYDVNDPVNGPSQGTLTGTYCVPADNLGTMTITGSGLHTETFAFVLQPNGNGSIIPYDANHSDDASGIFLKQNTNDFSTSNFTGQYSLGFIGVDNANSRFGLAGAFSANGTANLTNGELDGDDGGNYFNGTFSSSNFNVTSSGRGTVTLNVSGVGTGNFAFYVVNSSQLLVLQIDPIAQGLQTLFSGQVVQQQGLTYSDSDLNGVSVLGLQGLDTGCNPACATASLVFVTWNGSGSESHSQDKNDGGTLSSNIGSGTYSVGPNGRVTVSGDGEHSPIFYLTGKNAGFVAPSGGSTVEFGSMVAQSGSNFNNNSISGNYYGGSWELVSSSACGEVDLANVTSGSGNDIEERNCGESPTSRTNSFTYTVSSNGRTVVTANGLPSGIAYIVSPSSGGSGGSFIFLPWEHNSNPTLLSFGVFSATLTLSSPAGTAQVGVAYTSALVASGGVAPYTYSIAIGALPPGLSLNSSTGAITGTPTMAGTYNFTAKVMDSGGNTATASCSIVVASAALALSSPTGTAQVGVAYSSALLASGGVAPYTFSIVSGSLPPGLTLNTSTGAITGTPTSAGTYNCMAQVVDSQGSMATASCTITVTSAGTSSTTTSLTLAPSSVLMGSVGPIVMTATVTPIGGGTPTGSVTYFNGSTQVGTTTLSGGVGTFNYNPSSLAVGIYSITAVYSGDSMFSASTSPSQTLAITQNGPFAYAANMNDNTVSVINIPTASVVNTIPVGSAPSGVAISPDQTQIYVTNNHSNNVSVIGASSNSVVATIPVQSSPVGVAFTPDGTAAYVVNSASNNVSVINKASQTVTATVPVQSSPVGVAMAFTTNGTFAYVTNEASDSVSVIAVASNTVMQTIPVGAAPRWVAVSPNSSLAYVSNSGSGTVSVISVANNNTVTATIPVGMSPFGVAFTPDSNFAYVANSGSNTVSVIDTANAKVVATVAGFNNPVQVAITADGTVAYVTNQNTNNVSVITTSSNKITGTVAVGSAPMGVAIATAPPAQLQITMPLSPTQPNMFNFGTNNQVVQYPPGTQFSGVNMTTTVVQITQAQFQQRVAGTQFASAACIVYSGAGGNCVDYEVTCSDNNGNAIACPSESQPTIAVQTGFSTQQAITNPGYLTTPIGQNLWQNIFTGFADPTVKGKTQGFSEFVAVDLGANNPQGLAQFKLLHPKLPRSYRLGTAEIPVAISLKSVATRKEITDAHVSISVVMIADANGNPTQQVFLSAIDAFTQGPPGLYKLNLDSGNWGAGTYDVTIYGNAFPAYQGQFTIRY